MSRIEAGDGSSGLTMGVAGHLSESLSPSDCVLKFANVGDGLRQLGFLSLPRRWL
jgi:hypothetical protein